jgi:hypothetical protein
VRLSSGYDWFAPLLTKPMCQVDHWIGFINGETGEVENLAKGSSVFVYFGQNPFRFYYLFRQFGACGQLSYDW